MRCPALFILFLLVQAAAGAALDWKEGKGYRSLAVDPVGPGKEGFILVTQGGISFTNVLLVQRHLTNQILLNGSGVALGDVDGDGWCDIYFCSLEGRNALYRNLGNWKFEDVTRSASVTCEGLAATGAALVDLDGDGDLDLIVNSLGQGTHLFYNDGRGRFTESAMSLNQGRGGMSLALGDLDGDGFLDLYVANYRTVGLMDIPNARVTFKTVGGKPMVESFNGRSTTSPDLTNRFVVSARGAIEENGEADLVVRNVGGTNFAPFPLSRFLNEAGQPLATEPMGWGLAVVMRDINGDGLPDIYVCNDFQTEDRLWLQQKDGTFKLASRLAQRKSSMFSMAVDFADINRDGHDDFFVVDMLSRNHAQRMRDMLEPAPIYNIGEIDNRPQYSLNTLFLNRGDDTYAEIAQLSGVDASEWSWSCVFLDVDLDGWEDILIANGMERAARDLDIAAQLKAMRGSRRMSDAEVFQARKAFPRLATSNLAFRNRRNLTFEDASAQWNFNLSGISHGMALADLDNDGDLDVVVNNLNAPAAIYRNDAAAPRVAVRLKGAGANTHGIGGKIRVRGAGLPVQSQEMMAGGRYLSSDDSMRAFAAGQAKELSIEVEWRSGKRSLIEGVAPNHIYEMDETAAVPGVPQDRTAIASAPTMFEDVSGLLSYRHEEEAFDDYVRQPLLPRKLSQTGPAAAWIDVDGDGWEDLVIGAAKNHPLAVFRNNQLGGFQRMTAPPFNQPVNRDVGGLAGARLGSGSGKGVTVLATLSNYEDGLGYGAAIMGFQLQSGMPTEVAGAWDSAAGAMALADIDGDGDLDLFVAGAVMPGRYPAAANSRLFRNEGGKFVAIDTQAFHGVGLVNAAVFADFDNDGKPELLLACEWGSVRLFGNENGRFVDWTDKFGLSACKGLWQGLAVGDFDKDGRLDFVATNWGRNSKYESFRKKPIRLYYGDFDDDGTFDVIESHFEDGRYVPDRQLGAIGGAIQSVNARFRSNAAYAKAGVPEVLGDQVSRAQIVEANWFESTVFLNRGGRFEPRPLPVEAQFSPAFGACVGDFDGDGNDDIVLAQNFFAVSADTPRYDAGRALLLKGDGKGGFEAVPGQASGLTVYGEQRSVAAADYDHDGDLDLVITQNGAEVKLYRNRRKK